MNVRYQAMTAGACLLLASVGYSAEQARKPRPIGSHNGGIASAHFSPDGKFLATGGGDKMIRIWDVNNPREVRSFPGPTSFTCAVRYSPDGKTLAAAGYETAAGNPIYLFDPATGKELSRLDGHPTGGVRRVEFTPDGKTLVSGGFDGTVRVWDLASRKELRNFRADGGTVYGLAVSPDGKTVATAGRDGLKLWELNSGKELPRDPMSRHNSIAVAFSPDGKMLAAGDTEKVTLWESATGKQVGSLEGYRGELSQILFSSDGRTLYTASYDRLVRLWEVRTGRLIHEAEGHAGWVWGIALSPDEKTLASCSVDAKLVTWDLAGLGRPAGKKAQLTGKDIEKLLGDLASSDAGAAYRAVCALAGDPETCLPLLHKRLTEARRDAATPAALAAMVRDLDAEEWQVRQKASVDLEKAGAAAYSYLKKALEKPESLEVKRRAERLMRKLDPTQMPPEELAAIRGVQALEYMDNKEAKKLLERLAQAPGVRLAEEATQAVQRLNRTNR